MKKTVDCVKLMREIRAELTLRYQGKPELELRELREAREQFEARCAARRALVVAEAPVAYRASDGASARRASSGKRAKG